jgi:predicted nucleic acid-binding protein
VSLVFLDTNIFIYLFEDSGARGERVSQLIQRMAERKDRLATSALTLGEILVKPLELGNVALAKRYEAYFRSSEVLLTPLDATTSLRYAELRCDRTIRPPDAIQLACAASAGCDLFITNDESLARKTIIGIQFIVTLDRSPI